MTTEERLAIDLKFVNELYEAVPSLTAIIDEHEEFFDEVLPHIVMSDITRWSDQRLRERGPDAEVSCLLELLEIGMRDRGDEIAELVHVSFLENLPDETPVLELLGPNLREGLRQIRGG